MRFAATLAVVGIVAIDALYNEDLTIRPLPHVSKVAAHFSFHITTNEMSKFDVFPKSIGQIVQKYDVQELELSFTTGLWKNTEWGDVFGNGPYGASLKATLRNQSHWSGLTQQLAGLFSASLNKMDLTTLHVKSTSPPVLSANLPREEICTENISPWIKLLPCRSHAGLGGWIQPLNVLDANFLSMSLHITKSEKEIHLHQTLTVVRSFQGSTWSLRNLFGDIKPSTCPLASTSQISTELSTSHASALSAEVLRVDPIEKSGFHRHVVQVDRVSESISSGPWLAHVPDDTAPSSKARFVSGHRYLTGYGQVHGGTGLRLSNTHPTDTIRVSYHETMPWYLRVYYSTVKLSINGVRVNPLDLATFRIVPSVNRQPYELAFVVDIAPQSNVIMAYSFDKAFLPMGLHPPDANRGFDVAAASWTALNTTFFTEPLLVPLPTPDFSMPYNVIVLTSTIVAMTLGMMINGLLRHERKTNNIQWLLQKISSLVPSKKEKSD